jgi:hypothetical protein
VQGTLGFSQGWYFDTSILKILLYQDAFMLEQEQQKKSFDEIRKKSKSSKQFFKGMG